MIAKTARAIALGFVLTAVPAGAENSIELWTGMIMGRLGLIYRLR